MLHICTLFLFACFPTLPCEILVFPVLWRLHSRNSKLSHLFLTFPHTQAQHMAPAAYSFFSPRGISLLLLPIRVVSPIAQVVKTCAVMLKSQVSAPMMYEGEAVVEQFKMQFCLHPKCATTRSKINLMCKILQIALVKAQIPVSHFRCQSCSCSSHIFFSLRSICIIVQFSALPHCVPLPFFFAQRKAS